MTREEIEQELLAWMADPEWRPDEARFTRLALALFAHQVDRCTPYARFCQARAAQPAAISDWRDIPAVPTGSFKEVALRTFPESATIKTFRTSGTTDSRRGELSLDTLVVYEASLLPTWRRHMAPEVAAGERLAIRVLAPSPEEAPDSSLSHMFGCVLAAHGDGGSGYDVLGGSLRVDALVDRLHDHARNGTPVVLCGTAFAFVHLNEALADRRRSITLPTGSRVMETGGFKGRARERERDVLYGEIESALGIPARAIVNQYGMTELGSQFYDSVLLEPEAPRRKCAPPWVRVQLLDPTSGRPVAPGEVGMISILDLANTGSIASVSTADLGRSVGDGFEVLGRSEGAEERGCSVAADIMLGNAT